MYKPNTFSKLNQYKNDYCNYMCAKLLQLCLTLWSGLPWPASRDLPDPGIEPASPMSLALTDGFFTTGATWEAQLPPIFQWCDHKQ